MEFHVVEKNRIERLVPLFEENAAPLVGRSPLVKNPGLLMQNLYGETSRILAAVEGEEILGFVWMEELGDVINIPLIMVAAEERGKGVGRRLLLEAYDSARKRGFDAVTLEVLADNRPMEDLIAGLGFEKTGERPPYRTYRLEIY